jgi:hypothetical protein
MAERWRGAGLECPPTPGPTAAACCGTASGVAAHVPTRPRLRPARCDRRLPGRRGVGTDRERRRGPPRRCRSRSDIGGRWRSPDARGSSSAVVWNGARGTRAWDRQTEVSLVWTPRTLLASPKTESWCRRFESGSRHSRSRMGNSGDTTRSSRLGSAVSASLCRSGPAMPVPPRGEAATPRTRF